MSVKMKRKEQNQQGFITMIIMMFVILITALVVVYLRIRNAAG